MRTIVFIVFLAFSFSAASARNPRAEFDYFFGEEGARSYIRLPRGHSEVKAILYCHQNMTEEVLFRSKLFTDKMDSLGIAMAFIQRGSQNWDVSIKDEHGFTCQDRFENSIRKFAEGTEHPEIATAKIIPFGHSAQATFPWNFAAWNPEKTLCIISYHGDAPRTNLCGYGRANVEWGRTRNIDRIPALMVEGEYEWWEARVNPALAFRMHYPDSRISFLCDTERGHFDMSEETQAYMAKFIEKALHYVPLSTVSPDGDEQFVAEPLDGVYYSRWRADGKESDNIHDCFWYFDDEMVNLTKARYKRSLGKKMQYVSAKIDGKLVEYDPASHVKININCDREEFTLEPVFVDESRMMEVHEHAATRPRIVLISGPAIQVGEYTFRIDPDYFGKDPLRQWTGITLCVEADGDDEYKAAVQEMNVKLNQSDHAAVAGGMKATAIPLQDVRLLPSRWRDNMQRDSAWLMSLPVESMVHSFQTTAGVRAGKEGGYMTIHKFGGWESLDCELRGHCVGHMMSALALLHAQTGEECFKAKGDSIVMALAQVQSSYGNGYLSAFGQEQVERNIRGESVWAPFYTLHKVMAGLLDQYTYTGSTLALEIAAGMTEWAWNRLNGIGPEQRSKMLRNEFGGINEAFYNLYAITGNAHALEMAHFFYHGEVIGPLKKERNELGTLHTNTFIPKMIAEARNYEINGAPDSRRAVEFFWKTVTDEQCFATGCCSDKEHFFDPSELDRHLSGYTGETCCTYNMLKLTRHLFCWTADAACAGYYENAVLNHILGQQDPETGMVHYFQPMLSGAYKVYSTPRNSFWCCVGSGFESHAKYGEAIYFQGASCDVPLLFVNLFIPSVLQWKQAGLTIRQETDFPYGESTVLRVSGNATASIALRIPEWAQDPSIKVNGRNIRMSVENGYQAITRKWKDGDTVELFFPMKLTVEYANGSSERLALRYGPIVLAGELGTEGLESVFSDPSKYNDYYTYDYNIPDGLPVSLSPDLSDIQRTGQLSWRIGNTTISPLFDIHHQRYVVYWNAK